MPESFSPMSIALLVLTGLVLGALAALGLMRLLVRKEEKQDVLDGNEREPLMLIQNQINNFQSQIADFMRTVEARIGESSKEMQRTTHMQFGESQKLIREVTDQIASVRESNKQVFTIAEQLQSLEKVLKHQKQRGNLGEAALELILSNVLPPTAYKLQYQFRDGDTADAVIMTPEGLIPIDAKFSLDNYNRILSETDDTRRAEVEKDFRNDLKKRIDETAKYVRPEEGTLPFAFMFIPAEGIYYDLLINEVGAVKVNTRNLIDYAFNERKVIIVSPTTFAAYLQSVLYGFRAFKIEKSAEAIMGRVEDLRKHLAAYEEYMKKLGNALGTTVGHYTTAYKELKKVDKDVVKITGGEGIGIDPLSIEKPSMEEL